MKTNKLLSVALTLCVLLAAFSLTAFAAKSVTTAEDLATALAAGGEVRLDADITSVGAPVTVPAGVTATLDLNGHTLTVSKYTAKKDQVLVAGSLTLTDSVGTGKVCSDFTGTSGRVVSVSGSGSLQLVGGTITTEGMEKSGSAVYVAANCKFTMSGGTVYADAKRNNSAVNLVNAKASMEMRGGTITAIPTADLGDDVYAISAAYSPVKISAGTVSGHPAMSVGNGSAITGGVYNGVVKAKAGTITGGTFAGVDVISFAGYVDETAYACEKQADGSYTVAKAEFAAVATITGADGVVTRYAAATEAFSALKGGDTLKLLADAGTAAEPLPYGIVVTDGDVNVNLNAKTLIIGYDAAAAAAAGVPGYAAGVGIVNGGSGLLKVSGNGTVDVSKYTGTDGIAVWARTGSITVQSGTFINKSNEEATVYVGTNDNSAPVLKIAGGTYKNIAGGNYKYDESRTPLTFNIYNGKTADALKISAGSFYGNNDPYLGDDQVKGSILATEMTGVRKNDGYYVVAGGQVIQLLDANGGAKNFYTDVTKAFAGAADGDTLILLKNTSVSKQLNVTKAVTIDLGGYTLTNSYAPSNGGYTLLTRTAVTMKNGTYKSTKATARGIGAVADFTLENATLSAAGQVGLGCSAPDATYTVKNSTVSGNYAIANFVNNATINIIENSTITGSGVGIYHNGSNSGLRLTATGSTITAAATGKTNGIYVSGSTDTMAAAGAQQVTLTNCTVSGGTAVEVKYTDLTLTDCKVTATAETPSYTQDDNGATTAGFAVVSTDNTTGATTPAPKGTITIQGANGSYKGQVGLASLETVKTGYADFKDTTYAVSGGSFTKAVLPEYCAEGFVPAANADGTYTVAEAKLPVEVWTGYTGTSVAAYATVAEAAANLGGNKWIVITGDYTLTADFTIPADVRLDVADGAVLTVANGVILTVAENSKRFGIREGATVNGDGKVLVCGTSYSKGFVMLYGDMPLSMMTFPEGCARTNNGQNYFCVRIADAAIRVDYADGTTGYAMSTATMNQNNAVAITLLKDVEGAISIGKSVATDAFVVDLGGFTLTGSTTTKYGVLTLGNGKYIVKNGTVKNISDEGSAAAFMANSGGDIVIENDVVLDGGSRYGIYLSVGAITVKGTVTSDERYAISGHGESIHETTLTIAEGANISAPKAIGIYHPHKGTLNISGGTITGYTGVEMCAGTLNISGGTITSTGANHDETGSANAIKDGAAISIINRNYPGGTPSLNITDGTFKAEGADALSLKVYDFTAGKVAEWSDAGNYVNISGGSFKEAVLPAYCAAGFMPARNTDGTYTVAEQAENPFGQSFSVVNKPVMTQDGVEYYTVVVYSGIDSLNYKKAGFAYRMEATKKNGETVKTQDVKETTTAYKAISGTNNQGKTYTYTAEQIGAAYIYGQRFLFSVSDYTSANTALYVTPYVVTLDGKTIYGDEIELTETALTAKDSHLFWQGQ